MRRSIHIALLVLLPAVSFAQSMKKHFTAAADAVEDARDRARRSNTWRCREALVSQLDVVGDTIEGLRKHAHPREIAQVQESLVGYAATASVSRCPIEVGESLQRAIAVLEDARLAAWRNRRDDRHDDDTRPDTTFVQMSPLAVATNSVFDGEPAVRVSLPELQLYGLRGSVFYLGTRFRSFEGEWSQWVTTQQWTVPSDPFVWKNAFNHFFRYSTLAEDDFSDGRYIAHIGVFDGSGRELGFREVTFKARVPQLPPAPPVVVQPPFVRDCGTGNDPGCSMVRDGQAPMDGPTFAGFIQSLRANSNEMFRLDICRTLFSRNFATALQLSAVLDLFNNEMFRLEVGKLAAPRLVNPQHALGLAAKFRNNMFAREFTEVMARQPPGQVAPVVVAPVSPPPLGPPPTQPGRPPQPVPPQPVQPVQPMPPPPVAPVAYRDCGTGQDPGCTMMRHGQLPMDAPTFNGVLTALRNNVNELNRANLCESFFASNTLTALQLGMILDLFGNELTRLDVAKMAAPKVVNPSHALGFAAKWRNGLLGQDYSRLMAGQR